MASLFICNFYYFVTFALICNVDILFVFRGLFKILSVDVNSRFGNCPF